MLQRPTKMTPAASLGICVEEKISGFEVVLANINVATPNETANPAKNNKCDVEGGCFGSVVGSLVVGGTTGTL
jgi:hypothetical protein